MRDTARSAHLDGGELLDHLMMDLVWKAVIVGAGVVVVTVVMILLWKALGPRR